MLYPWANPQAFVHLVGFGGPWTLQNRVLGWLKMAVNVAFRDTRERVTHNTGVSVRAFPETADPRLWS